MLAKKVSGSKKGTMTDKGNCCKIKPMEKRFLTDEELMNITARYPYSFLDVKNAHAVVGDKITQVLDISIQLDRYNGRGDNLQVLITLLGQILHEGASLKKLVQTHEGIIFEVLVEYSDLYLVKALHPKASEQYISKREVRIINSPMFFSSIHQCAYLLARKVSGSKFEGNPKGRFIYGVIMKDKMFAVRANSPDEAAEFIHREKAASLVHVAPIDKILAKRWMD